MNAYELADELLRDNTQLTVKAAYMLRQQADRIKQLELQLFKATNRAIANRKKAGKLKKEKIRAYDNGYEDGQKSLTTNAEPVAWIRSGDDQLSLVKGKNDGYMIWKPLYTTPQTKPLSDADIQQISHRYHYTYNPDYIGFARAIEERILGK